MNVQETLSVFIPKLIVDEAICSQNSSKAEGANWWTVNEEPVEGMFTVESPFVHCSLSK